MKLTNRQKELFLILMEECAELQQQASKILRFGPESMYSGETSLELFYKELGDVLCMVKELDESGFNFDFDRIIYYVDRKKEKLEKWMKHKE